MRIGCFLPNIGPWAGADAVTRVALRAEELGFDSVWTTERLLYPLEPEIPYPVGDGTMPSVYKTTLDPLDTLAFVAGQTTRVALGTSVLNLPFYNPVLLARRLTTLDVLSNGRLRVGLGIGWCVEEHAAAGSEWTTRGKRFEEALQVLKHIWMREQLEFNGQFYRVPKSVIGAKPIQKPHPPIYLAAYIPQALDRVARLSDGWNPVGIRPAEMRQMFDGIKATANAAGRDATALQLIVRANVELYEQPLGADRAVYTGTEDQIADDIAATRALLPNEMVFDATFDPTIRSTDDLLDRLEFCLRLARDPA